jgi:hypothetical protein
MGSDLRQTISPNGGGPEGKIVCSKAVFFAGLRLGRGWVPNYQTIPEAPQVA